MTFTVRFFPALLALCLSIGGTGLAREASAHPSPPRPALRAAGAQQRIPTRIAGLRAQKKEAPASEALEKAKQREILGSDEGFTQDAKVMRFLQLVALPLFVCLVLILLLRRGLFGG